jgi:hypothetical protein
MRFRDGAGSPCEARRPAPFGRRGTGTFFGLGRTRKRTPGERKMSQSPAACERLLRDQAISRHRGKGRDRHGQCTRPLPRQSRDLGHRHGRPFFAGRRGGGLERADRWAAGAADNRAMDGHAGRRARGCLDKPSDRRSLRAARQGGAGAGACRFGSADRRRRRGARAARPVGQRPSATRCPRPQRLIPLAAPAVCREPCHDHATGRPHGHHGLSRAGGGRPTIPPRNVRADRPLRSRIGGADPHLQRPM